MFQEEQNLTPKSCHMPSGKEFSNASKSMIKIQWLHITFTLLLF